MNYRNKQHPFIEKLLPYAITVHRQTGIPASIMIAQAILESGYGNSQLAKLANNLFGIKAGTSWKGQVLVLPTKEYVDGKPVTVEAKWRKYNNYGEAFFDLAKVYYNGRYEEALAWRQHPIEFIRRAGKVYATDPSYADKIISIMEKHKLYKYDLPINQWQLLASIVPSKWMV